LEKTIQSVPQHEQTDILGKIAIGMGLEGIQDISLWTFTLQKAVSGASPYQHANFLSCVAKGMSTAEITHPDLFRALIEQALHKLPEDYRATLLIDIVAAIGNNKIEDLQCWRMICESCAMAKPDALLLYEISTAMGKAEIQDRDLWQFLLEKIAPGLPIEFQAKLFGKIAVGMGKAHIDALPLWKSLVASMPNMPEKD
jgi:hypothetical protein